MKAMRSLALFVAAFVLASFALLAIPSRARATPNYPDVVAGALGLSYTPPCALCHVGGRTGLGTVNTPFGKSLRAHGGAARDDGSIEAALAAMEKDGTSSLHDGASDVAKLKKGQDPNGGDASALSAEPPAYGCGGRIAARPGDVSGVAATLVVVAIASFVRVRRRPRIVRHHA